MRPIRRRLVFAAPLIASPAVLPARAQHWLGLGERRGIAAFEETVLPGLRARIDEAAGFEVPITIEWEKVASEEVAGKGEQFTEPEFFTAIYFLPLIEALKSVGRDRMGREALKAGLKRVLVTNGGYHSGPSFQDGTLTIDYRPNYAPADVADRARAIVQVLERGL